MNVAHDAYKKKLKEAGYKLTPQRIAIINVIADNKGKHLSTEEIYDIVKIKNPEMGLATVYRTLQLLDELEIESGHLAYHLRNLNDLLDKDKSGKYFLNRKGIDAHVFLSGKNMIVIIK